MLWLLAAHAADPFETHARVHTLDNGLTVILEEDHRIDAVALNLMYGVGSRDELDGERGFAHLFEHLMFEGSTHAPGTTFDESLEAAGAWNNAWTSEDNTAYHEVLPAGALDLALFLESDRMGFLDGGLDDENLDNQQLVVLQERAEGYADPHGRDWDSLTRLQFPEGHPYHIPVIGTVADIEGLELAMADSFWRRWYQPSNAVMALVGNIGEDPLPQVVHWFSDVADNPVPERAPPWTGGYQPADGYITDAVDYRTLYISWATVPHGHPDEPALDILAAVLSNGPGTRLDDALYYDSNKAIFAGAWTSNGDVDGQFAVVSGSPRTKPKKLEKLMERAVFDVVDNPPTDDELVRARNSYRTQILDALETYDGRAALFVQCWLDFGDPNCARQAYTPYEMVTAEDVVRVIQTYLVPERRVTLSVVPHGDKKMLKGATLVELP